MFRKFVLPLSIALLGIVGLFSFLQAQTAQAASDFNVVATSGYGQWGPLIVISGTISTDQDVWATISDEVLTVTFMHVGSPVVNANAYLDGSTNDIRYPYHQLQFHWNTTYAISFFGGDQANPDFDTWFGTVMVTTPVTPVFWATVNPIVVRSGENIQLQVTFTNTTGTPQNNQFMLQYPSDWEYTDFWGCDFTGGSGEGHGYVPTGPHSTAQCFVNFTTDQPGTKYLNVDFGGNRTMTLRTTVLEKPILEITGNNYDGINIIPSVSFTEMITAHIGIAGEPEMIVPIDFSGGQSVFILGNHKMVSTMIEDPSNSVTISTTFQRIAGGPWYEIPQKQITITMAGDNNRGIYLESSVSIVWGLTAVIGVAGEPEVRLPIDLFLSRCYLQLPPEAISIMIEGDGMYGVSIVTDFPSLGWPWYAIPEYVGKVFLPLITR